MTNRLVGQVVGGGNSGSSGFTKCLVSCGRRVARTPDFNRVKVRPPFLAGRDSRDLPHFVVPAVTPDPTAGRPGGGSSGGSRRPGGGWTIAIATALILLSSCGPTIHPPEGIGTSYPCGIHGKSCGGRMCCGELDVCGYDGPGTRCEVGYCCYEGPDWPFERKRQRRQWAEVSR